MKRKKKNKNLSFAMDARRKNEIMTYGKVVSLRPSVAHASKKIYDRKRFKAEHNRINDD